MNASFWILVVVFVVLGLSMLFLVPNVLLERRNLKSTGGVIAASLFGVVLGWGAFFGVAAISGQQVKLSVVGFTGETITLPADSGEQPVRSGAFGAFETPSGSGSGRGAPGGGAGGGRPSPSSRRGLTTLVRKLDLLTSDIAVKFSPKQSKEIAEVLVKSCGGEKMTDEQAKVALDAVQAVLSDDQKAVLERIGLPRRRRSGSGQGPQDENPFTDANNHKTLVSLLKRHGVEPPEITVKTTDGPSVREQSNETGEGRGGDNTGGNIIEIIIKQHDKDGDGTVSKDEAPEFLRSRFERIDTNKDGKCDLQEMLAARRLIRGG